MWVDLVDWCFFYAFAFLCVDLQFNSYYWMHYCRRNHGGKQVHHDTHWRLVVIVNFLLSWLDSSSIESEGTFHFLQLKTLTAIDR